LAKAQGIQIKRPPIYRIFFMQVTACLSICIGFYVISGRVAAYSSLIGGGLFILPQLYFGFKAFLYSGARSVQKIVVNFYRGESTKILVIAVGFALVFSFIKPIDYFALYFTFVCVLVLNCFSPYLAGK